MPYLWDQTADAPPQAELNPLTNPILERNLARWAQAYFGNPPGKREEAISRLLQEIRRETFESRKTEPLRDALPPSQASQDMVCVTCRHKNPLGQKFCGQCGETLGRVASAARNLAATRSAPEAPAAQPESELQWLRDRSLGTLHAIEASQVRGWKYVVGGLMIAFAGFAYLQWAPKPQSRVAHPSAAAPQVNAPQAPLPVRASSSAGISPETISPATQPARVQPGAIQLGEVRPSEAQSGETPPGMASAVAHERMTAPPGLRPAAQKSSLLAIAPRPEGTGGSDSGALDLRLAQRYLGGSMGVRDSSEAAKLLWKAVRQENPAAALLLSDLYLRGDGVPRSCDQARLLLVAATKRGTPQAAEQLRRLESHGCR